jgi:type II secretory pathway predicted ATPase ExeA
VFAVGKVDEAHLLDNQQLEAIRLLTNHDMDAGSPFAVVLIGQPTLRQRSGWGCSPRWISASRCATRSPG